MPRTVGFCCVLILRAYRFCLQLIQFGNIKQVPRYMQMQLSVNSKWFTTTPYVFCNVLKFIFFPVTQNIVILSKHAIRIYTNFGYERISFRVTRRVRKVNIHHVQGDRETFYAYCGNTAVDLDPLPVSRARLIVVEPALFE